MAISRCSRSGALAAAAAVSIDGQTTHARATGATTGMRAIPPVGASEAVDLAAAAFAICNEGSAPSQLQPRAFEYNRFAAKESIHSSCLIPCTYFKDDAITNSTGVGRHGHGRLSRLLWTWRHSFFHRSFQRVWGFTRRWTIRWQEQGRVSFILAEKCCCDG